LCGNERRTVVLIITTNYCNNSKLNWHAYVYVMWCMSSQTIFNTSSFFFFSVPLTLSILLQNHISIASNLLLSSFLNVRVCQPYNAALQFRFFTIFFFGDLIIFLVSNSFRLPKASFAISIDISVCSYDYLNMKT